MENKDKIEQVNNTLSWVERTFGFALPALTPSSSKM